MKWLRSFFLASVLLSGAALAHAADPAAIAAARRDLHAGVTRADVAALQSVRARFSTWSQLEPGDAHLHYWVGLASWRLLALQISKDPDRAAKVADDALAHLDRALEIDPKFAEALALMGGVQGMVIQVKPSAMMTLGPQSGANLKRAISLAPTNPRVWVLSGIGTLHTPATFGGGPKAALEEFRRAQELFASETVADSTAPDWGRDDACVWEGRAAMKLGDAAAARDAYRRALAVNPDHVWVRDRLLPEAERAAGSTAK